MNETKNGNVEWQFCLYVAGESDGVRLAMDALEMFQIRFLGAASPVDVVHLGSGCRAGSGEEFLVMPTAVRVRPRPRVVIPAPRNVEDVVRYLRVAGAGFPAS